MARRLTEFRAACDPSNPVLINGPDVEGQSIDLRPATADVPQHRTQHHAGNHQGRRQQSGIAAIGDGANESTKACSARTFNV
jgi:hypothetical protein